MTASDHVRVVLDQVQTKLTGMYLCEVTVSPSFFVLAESANMTIIGRSHKMIHPCTLKSLDPAKNHCKMIDEKPIYFVSLCKLARLHSAPILAKITRQVPQVLNGFQ
mgnify:CR=1 FL=1